MSTEQSEDGNAVADVKEQFEAEEQDNETPETPEVDDVPDDPEPDAEDDKPSDDADGEVEVSFGDAPAQQAKPTEEQKAQDNNVIRQMRQRIRELESKVKTQEPAPTQLGPEPTFEEHDFDADKFKRAYADWLGKKQKVDDEARQAQERQQKAAEGFQARLNHYREARKTLPAADFEDAEDAVMSTLSVVQQNIILAHAESPEKLVLALGKDGDRLKDLSAIVDPLEFVKRMTQLEGKLTVTTKKKTPPPPDKKVTNGGSGGLTKSTDRLVDEALKTGDASALARAIAQKAK